MAYDAIIRWENEGGAVLAANPADRDDPSAAETNAETKGQETAADPGAPLDREQRLELEGAF